MNKFRNYFNQYSVSGFNTEPIFNMEYIESRIKMIEEEISKLDNRISNLETTITNNKTNTTNNMYMI